ncbi:hypothetical protein D0859_11244 [Hortaea werneckii]|uniref:Major facilitator superfamily (MFS) profile domain-containing protein n=1 Tax=Hortaea werneckii TaxID=91943 RepID=A0A3M7IGM0_HORWE|nr:hypothetical protein D0859_11244 [Hortaea werneckii]
MSTPRQSLDRRSSIAVEDVAHIPDVSNAITGDAAKATASETSMTLLQGLQTYPKAVGWSILLSTCIIMEGFDIVLINSLYALPAFQRRFGSLQEDGTYGVSAAWQSGLSKGALVGEIFGLFLTGIVAERLGYKKTMVGALAMLTGFVFLLFFAQNLPMLLVGEVACTQGPQRRCEEAAVTSDFAKPSRLDPDATISMMIYANELEKEHLTGARYLDCLYALGAVGTLGSWFLMGWFGRRTLYLWGQILMSLVLVIVRFMGIANSSGAQWAVAAMMLLFTFIYDATVGPGAKAGFFWGGACVLCAIWTFFRLPEPKGRTYAELDVLFQAKVSVRRFASTDVSALSGSQSGHGSDEKSLHDAEHYEVKLGSEKTEYIQTT